MRYLFFFLLLLSATIDAFAQDRSALFSKLQAADADKVNIYFEISKLYAASEPDSAVYYCKVGMGLAEKQNNVHGQGLLLLQLGTINALHGHAELARKFDNEALSIFRSLHDKEAIALAYDELGLLDGQQQNMMAATEHLGKAMKFYEDARDSMGILETYSRLGIVYEEKGETEKALTYYLRALVQYEHRFKKPDGYFALLRRISQLYLKKGNDRIALQYLEEGARNSDNPLFRDTRIALLDDEGKILEDDGDKAHALHFYKQALADAKRFNRPEEQAKALTSIAGILKKENASLSLQDLKEALHIAETLHQPQLESRIYEALAEVYRQEKDYREAMMALEEHDRLLDSLIKADTNTEVAALDSSYVLETSREEINSLQHVNKKDKVELRTGFVILIGIVIILILLWFYLRKVRKLNLELKASNQVKDTLFSIIGHDLKGPAGSATQLFSLMETEDFTQEEMKGMLSELKKQTEVSFELLNSLFEWGKSQLQGVHAQPVNIITKPVISKNISLLVQQATLKDIIIEDHTLGDIQIFGDPNHFDFIIRNLLSNAIKFTFAGGRIDIYAKEESNEIVYSVKDTGVGISEAQQHGFLKTNLSVSFGTKGEKGSGLGLLLIKEFLKANGGRIWLESKEGEGATFFFTFPKGK